MPLVNMKQMLNHAHANGYAVGAFDVVSLDFVTGVMAAAEQTASPVILSLAESHFQHYDFELLMAAVEAAAKRAAVPVAIHLDHGESLESAIDSIRLGCNGVMVDASHTGFKDNVETTAQVVSMAQACGIPVEGELGYVPGVEGEDAEQHPGEMIYTSVDEARQFVALTGVDFLAVSIGTVHGRMKGEPNLDFERLQQINESLAVPLVLHGGTGLSEEQYQRLIENGIAKINYYTALADAAGACVGSNAAQNLLGYTGLMQGVSDAIHQEAARCMSLWGSAGRASEVLAECDLWLPVEHLIIYNTSIDDEQQINHMMEEGRRVLGAIPGVRRVFTGDAVQESAGYRYTWLVKFCHPAVIDSYREHVDHVAFADGFFRPIAGDRISIDYQAVEDDEHSVATHSKAKMSA
ncbi:MAG: ketose-bisphosphate aldolase [Candidatus Thiodiazotropha taylori]|nr:ketose-bisphosphate aldolase [Candidatus Thiodiazotropha taylori]MCW4246215.1 ketose-bisphosphate aldolase [Candidatus Thiodiazotropha taylori]